MKKHLLAAITFAALTFTSTIALSLGGCPGVTPDEALRRLQTGNERFAQGVSEHPRIDSERRLDTIIHGQYPYATILTCSDSRVPPEIIFDQGIGDLFVIRVAGNVADIDEIASIEYGAEHLLTPIVVVLGHTKCGAVTAVAQGAEATGHLPQLLDNIVPAVRTAKAKYPNIIGNDIIPAAIEENVWQSIEDMLTKSHEIKQLVRSGQLKVVGAIYDLESGEVKWLGTHPRQEKLLSSEAAHGEKAAPAPSQKKPASKKSSGSHKH